MANKDDTNIVCQNSFKYRANAVYSYFFLEIKVKLSPKINRFKYN